LCIVFFRHFQLFLDHIAAILQALNEALEVLSALHRRLLTAFSLGSNRQILGTDGTELPQWLVAKVR